MKASAPADSGDHSFTVRLPVNGEVRLSHQEGDECGQGFSLAVVWLRSSPQTMTESLTLPRTASDEPEDGDGDRKEE